jgi:hypothetical protein
MKASTAFKKKQNIKSFLSMRTSKNIPALGTSQSEP